MDRRFGLRRKRVRMSADGPPGAEAFTYADVPDQLIRINSLEGSLGFSGATLTSVTDKSAAAQTVNVTSSPTYNATTANLNNAPSWTNGLVVAPNIARTSVRFAALVFEIVSGTTLVMLDGTSASNRLTVSRTTLGDVSVSTGTTLTIGDLTTGRKILILALDGATQSRWNGSDVGITNHSVVGTGMAFASNYVAGGDVTMAFAMLCSSVPSAEVRSSLESLLQLEFGV
jgi:hypothetical protein